MALEPQRFETAGPMMFAGTDEYYTYAERGGVAGQWSRFDPMPEFSAECAGYGVSHAMDGRGFRYLCGVRVAGEDGLPERAATLCVPAQRYAVFLHRGHVSALGATCEAMMCDWLPRSGATPAAQPVMLERYGEAFDPATGSGVVEVWFALGEPEK